MKRSPLRSDPAKTAAWRGRTRKPMQRTAMKRSASKPRRVPVSAASSEQRAKVCDAHSIVSGEYGCDPAHVWPRSLGGCNHVLCVVPLTRTEHDAYDLGDLDLLPHLIRAGCVAELQHALAHVDGSLLRLLNRTTNQRWAPEREPTSGIGSPE